MKVDIERGKFLINKMTEEYEVEKILQRGRVGQQTHYRVLWKGYSEQQATWEPITNLINCMELVCQFEKQMQMIQNANLKHSNQDSNSNDQSKSFSPFQPTEILKQHSTVNTTQKQHHQQQSTRAINKVTKKIQNSNNNLKDTNRQDKQTNQFNFSASQTLHKDCLSKKQIYQSSSQDKNKHFSQKQKKKLQTLNDNKCSQQNNNNKQVSIARRTHDRKAKKNTNLFKSNESQTQTKSIQKISSNEQAIQKLNIPTSKIKKQFNLVQDYKKNTTKKLQIIKAVETLVLPSRIQQSKNHLRYIQCEKLFRRQQSDYINAIFKKQTKIEIRLLDLREDKELCQSIENKLYKSFKFQNGKMLLFLRLTYIWCALLQKRDATKWVQITKVSQQCWNQQIFD